MSSYAYSMYQFVLRRAKRTEYPAALDSYLRDTRIQRSAFRAKTPLKTKLLRGSLHLLLKRCTCTLGSGIRGGFLLGGTNTPAKTSLAEQRAASDLA